jgi:hypothetical protein
MRQRNQDALAIGALTAAGIDLIDPVRVTLPLRAPVVATVVDGLGGRRTRWPPHSLSASWW